MNCVHATRLKIPLSSSFFLLHSIESNVILSVSIKHAHRSILIACMQGIFFHNAFPAGRQTWQQKILSRMRAIVVQAENVALNLLKCWRLTWPIVNMFSLRFFALFWHLSIHFSCCCQPQSIANEVTEGAELNCVKCNYLSVFKFWNIYGPDEVMLKLAACADSKLMSRDII